MSTVNKIKVVNPDPVLKRSALDGQTLARVAHVNEIVDEINDAFNYSTLGFGIVDLEDGSNTPGLVGVGERGSVGSVSNGGCRPGTQPYTYSNGSHGCISAILRIMYNNYLPVVENPEVGIYTFTFPKAPPLGYDILMSPPSKVIGTRLKVTKVNDTTFTISAQDAAGGSADGLLAGMYLEIKIYN